MVMVTKVYYAASVAYLAIQLGSPLFVHWMLQSIPHYCNLAQFEIIDVYSQFYSALVSLIGQY